MTRRPPLSPESQVDKAMEHALAEDLGRGDITTKALGLEGRKTRAYVLAKSKGILAGIDVAAAVFLKVDGFLKIHILVPDGTELSPGTVVAKIEGDLASLLKGERVALNFLQRLSGIATETSRYVRAVEGLPVRILDTRKTTPGLRALEKRAVRAGGGWNHRMDLGDGILIKDNHLAALAAAGAGIREAVVQARLGTPDGMKVEVEVDSVDKARQAVEAGADIIMLDNMGLEEMRHAVSLINKRALVEASGGITLENVRAVAETGVDWISIGALTHSPKALDLSLEIETP